MVGQWCNSVVEHMPQQPKDEGLSPATEEGRKKSIDGYRFEDHI